MGLVEFMDKQTGKLPFGSLITEIFDKKELLQTYVNSSRFLTNGIIWPTSLKPEDFERMKVHSSTKERDNESSSKSNEAQEPLSNPTDSQAAQSSAQPVSHRQDPEITPSSFLR